MYIKIVAQKNFKSFDTQNTVITYIVCENSSRNATEESKNVSDKFKTQAYLKNKIFKRSQIFYCERTYVLKMVLKKSYETYKCILSQYRRHTCMQCF